LAAAAPEPVSHAGAARARRPSTPSATTSPSAHLDGRAQPRRPGARIRGHLGRARLDRAALDRAQLRLVPADADREVGRARAAALALAEEALDDPILERVEADHRKPSAGPQQLERRRQRGLERSELLVDRDPQRLEDALRRMPVAEPRRRGNRRPDRLDEIARPLERLLAPPPDDRPRDLPRVPLLAVPPEDRRQLFLV